MFKTSHVMTKMSLNLHISLPILCNLYDVFLTEMYVSWYHVWLLLVLYWYCMIPMKTEKSPHVLTFNTKDQLFLLFDYKVEWYDVVVYKFTCGQYLGIVLFFQKL